MTLYLIRMKLPFRMVRENNISLFNLHPNVPRKLVSKSCGLVRILEHPTLPNLPTHTPFKKNDPTHSSFFLQICQARAPRFNTHTRLSARTWMNSLPYLGQWINLPMIFLSREESFTTRIESALHSWHTHTHTHTLKCALHSQLQRVLRTATLPSVIPFKPAAQAHGPHHCSLFQGHPGRILYSNSPNHRELVTLNLGH